MILGEDIQFQLSLLCRDGYHAAARIIEILQGTISRKAELEYLKKFVQYTCFDDGTSRDQLRCLWTVYCCHHKQNADTFQYDNDLHRLWNVMGGGRTRNSRLEQLLWIRSFYVPVSGVRR